MISLGFRVANQRLAWNRSEESRICGDAKVKATVRMSKSEMRKLRKVMQKLLG